MKFLYNIPQNLSFMLNAPEAEGTVYLHANRYSLEKAPEPGDISEKMEEILALLAHYLEKSSQKESPLKNNANAFFSFFLDNCYLIKSDPALNMLIYELQLKSDISENQFFALFLQWGLQNSITSFPLILHDFICALTSSIPADWAREFTGKLESMFMKFSLI